MPALMGQSPAEPGPSQAASVLERFLGRPTESLTHYRAVRHLEARNQRFKKHGWMDVVTTLSPEEGFRYTVVGEGGSEYIQRKVLRPILEGERDVIVRGDVTRSALTSENYELAEVGETEPGITKLSVRPKRKDITLVDGQLSVSSLDGDLLLVSGRLAKNPSFWTKRVDVVRRYGRVAGVRVPLGIESTAQVRIAGTSSMSMTYTYEMVNGVVVKED